LFGHTAQEHEEHQLKQESPDWSIVSRTAVLADAEGLLTCYGVGEESTGQLTHAVIELCFTSSVRFLQPGLLLQVRLGNTFSCSSSQRLGSVTVY
jgi:hypothetical protein